MHEVGIVNGILDTVIRAARGRGPRAPFWLRYVSGI